MPSKRTARVLSAGLALLIVLQAATPAWAWGRRGHRVIAKLAERHLTGQAKAEIKALLEPGESLADCSTWADEHRRKMPKTAPWHYVDVPLEERRQALRFLVHLVEDIHMPLHVGENHDKGGNQLRVRSFDRGSNLHSVWDTGIITRAQPDEGRWFANLIAMDTPEALSEAQEGSVEDWATQSLLAARQAYQDPATSRRMKLGVAHCEVYHDANLPGPER